MEGGLITPTALIGTGATKGVTSDSALSGIALSEPSLTDDWLHPKEEEAWAHLQ